MKINVICTVYTQCANNYDKNVLNVAADNTNTLIVLYFVKCL